MQEKDKNKGEISINANPAGTLEIKEFKNRMAEYRRGVLLKSKKK